MTTPKAAGETDTERRDGALCHKGGDCRGPGVAVTWPPPVKSTEIDELGQRRPRLSDPWNAKYASVVRPI